MNGRLAFVAERDGAADIWVMYPDGYGAQNITHDVAIEASPAWSPDGSHIAYADLTDAANGHADIWVMDALGGNRTNLTALAGGLNNRPSWSPDGTQIAYESSRTPANNASAIRVMNADGTNDHVVVTVGLGANSPAWTPDGTKLAFMFAPLNPLQPGDEIAVVNVDGTGFADLTNTNGASESDPAWSPDGTQLVYVSDQVNVWVMNSDGTDQHVITGGVEPEWSPDGTRIAFSTYQDSRWGIWTVHPDGSSREFLTGSWHGYMDFANDGQPSWQRLSVTSPDPSGEFHPLTPTRIWDQRPTFDVPQGYSFMRLPVEGMGGLPDHGVRAVVLNVTVVDPTEAGFVTVWAGDTRPTVSNLNFVPGQTVPNLVTVALGSHGHVNFYTLKGRVGLVVDLMGYYSSSTGTAGSRHHGVSPARLFDTRDGLGGIPASPIAPDTSLRVQVTNRGGVPASGVTAVVMNVTVTDPTDASYVTVYPDDVARPIASNLNFVAGQTVPNLVTVRVAASGVLDFYNHTGTTQLIADVVGYYDDDRSTNAGRFVPVDPVRLLDTRDANRPFGPGEIRHGGVPNAGASAAVLNVTATEPTAPGYLTLFPADACDPPLASNLNFVTGQTVPNLVIVRVSAQPACGAGTGEVGIYNFTGNTHVVVDLFGYFTSG